MNLSKKSLAKLFFRIRVELFGRPGYGRHYRFIFEQRLPADSRSMKRARWKSVGYTFALAIILIEVTNFLVASQFSFARFTANWPNPFAIVTWIWHQSSTRSTSATVNAALDAINARAFAFTVTAGAIDALLLLVFSQLVYWLNRWDRWLLSNEKGSANWILPEKLAQSGLLPPNYDIYAGFEPSEYERIEYDAMLQREQNDRIAAYATAFKEWEATHNPDPNRPAITLPIYGNADAMYVTTATQTDVGAPWLQQRSTPTDAMPKEPTNITLPDFETAPSPFKQQNSNAPDHTITTP